MKAPYFEGKPALHLNNLVFEVMVVQREKIFKKRQMMASLPSLHNDKALSKTLDLPLIIE
jgi:hypothetical protein